MVSSLYTGHRRFARLDPCHGMGRYITTKTLMLDCCSSNVGRRCVLFLRLIERLNGSLTSSASFGFV